MNSNLSWVPAVKIDNPVFFEHKVIRTMNSNSPIRIVFASRLAPNKGIMDVIEAARILRTEPFKFEIYGIGELYSSIDRIIKKEKLNVTLFGNVPLNDLQKSYLDGDVYIFPSYHTEGFPMSLFFAVGAGLPIIATRVRPLPDFLKDSQNCLWVEKKSPEMIAIALRKLAEDPELRFIMSQANLELIKEFEPGKVVDDLLKSFDNINS